MKKDKIKAWVIIDEETGKLAFNECFKKRNYYVYKFKKDAMERISYYKNEKIAKVEIRLLNNRK